MIAIYARVSTEEQAKHGFSLMDQIRACRAKVGEHDVLEYVDEGVSGEFLDRPELSRLRRDIREGLIHQVICLDPDRLSRKLMNQLILSDEIESRAQIVFVNGEYARTPEGQLFYQMRGAISQFEKAKINERMSRGRREKARQGRVLRDFQIYGYDYDASRECFVINEREATVVRLVFDLFINPSGRVQGINGIARYLTELGIPTKRGTGVFHRQVVRQMLMNRAYIGEFFQNKWNTEGMLGNRFKPPEEKTPQRLRPKEEWIPLPIPAIIGRDQFRFAQTLLEESRRRWAGKSKRAYLLSGLLRCGHCGNTLTGRKMKSWGRETYYYSDRKSTAGAKNPGCGLLVACEPLEAAVWETVLSFVGAPDDEALSLVEDDDASKVEQFQLRHVDEELKRLEHVASRLLDLIGDPEIGQEDIREKFREVQEQRRALREKKEVLLSQMDESATHAAEERHTPRSCELVGAWRFVNEVNPRNLDPKLRRDLIRTIVKEVRVFDRAKRIEIVTF